MSDQQDIEAFRRDAAVKQERWAAGRRAYTGPLLAEAEARAAAVAQPTQAQRDAARARQAAAQRQPDSIRLAQQHTARAGMTV
jgi:hypothetical protein